MASCNGCDLARKKKVYGDRLIKFRGSWYEKGALPGSGQIENALPDGTPIHFVAWYMDEGHCYDSTCSVKEVERAPDSKSVLENTLRGTYQILGGEWNAPIEQIMATIRSLAFRTAVWTSVKQPPDEEGEYLVQHFLMKNGFRLCPKIDRALYQNGEWSEKEVTHWKPICYPENQT